MEFAMPSPFPGMDPYLEGSLWTTVHAELAVEMARQLAPRLRPHYLALPQKRFVLANVEPDDGVGVSMPEPIPQFSVEIRDTEQRRLVTDIEVLSPTNKGSGREEY